EHPDVATTLSNIGGVLAEKQQYTAAEPMFREAVAIARKALGAGHITIAWKLTGLSNTLRELGKYDEAVATAEEGLRIGLPGHGPRARRLAAAGRRPSPGAGLPEPPRPRPRRELGSGRRRAAAAAWARRAPPAPARGRLADRRRREPAGRDTDGPRPLRRSRAT